MFYRVYPASVFDFKQVHQFKVDIIIDVKVSGILMCNVIFSL